MLEINNLSFNYGKEQILRDISFSAKPGKITSIIGANGAGKSTLLKCIAGLEKTNGGIKLLGKNRNDLTFEEIASSISYLEQGTDCYADLSVFEIILLGRLEKLSYSVSDDDITRVENVMDMMGISSFADRKIGELSGGQRQMVFIAQSLVKNPKILLLDEPTSALDLNRQFALMNFLTKITKEANYTTVLTMHHLDIAAKYSDEVVVINDGVVYSQGSPEDVFTDKMLRDVFKVEAEVTRDKFGAIHINATNSIGKGF